MPQPTIYMWVEVPAGRFEEIDDAILQLGAKPVWVRDVSGRRFIVTTDETAATVAYLRFDIEPTRRPYP